MASLKIVKVISPSTTIEIAALPWKTYLTNWSPVRPKNQPRGLRRSATRVGRRVGTGAISVVAGMPEAWREHRRGPETRSTGAGYSCVTKQNRPQFGETAGGD